MSRRTRARQGARKLLPDDEAIKLLKGTQKPKAAPAKAAVGHWDQALGKWVGGTSYQVHSYKPLPEYTPPTKREHVDLPLKVVTLDMDGTMEDPWACCGDTDFYGGTAKCRHLRQDTLDRAIAVRDAHGPETEFVIVSWRSDLSDIVEEWCGNVGLEVARIFTDGSPDTKLLGHGYRFSQVPFKLGIIKELQARGVEVVGAFDDNQKVIDAIAAHGVEAHLSPHLVEPVKYKLSAYPPHAKQKHYVRSSSWDFDGFSSSGVGAGRAESTAGKLTPAQQVFLDGQTAKAKARDKEPRDLSHLGARWQNVGITADDTLTIAMLESGDLDEADEEDLWDLIMADLPTAGSPDEDAEVDLL